MGQLTRKWDHLLRVFYEYPQKVFTVREISKRARLPKSSVQKYLQVLQKEGLITKDHRTVPSLLFKIKKTNYYLEQLVHSGLVDYLVTTLNPSCIILFGSIRKGDSVAESDIDLFIETSVTKELTLVPFEKKLGHPIQLHLQQAIQDLPPLLFNNVINGIKLYGSFKLK